MDEYERSWLDRGYSTGIPDEAYQRLESLGLVPSYRQIAMALLKNDMQLTSLGFQTPVSDWYGAFKRIELRERNKGKLYQMYFKFLEN